MPTIRFQSRCRFCNRAIDWEGLYRVGRVEDPTGENQFELTSTGFSVTAKGNKIMAMAIVNCKVCKNRNRYKIEFLLDLN